MTNNTSLTILSTAIRQDAQGRYCLNDCHKASGGEAAKRPSEWMSNAQTKALVAEISQSGNSRFAPTDVRKGGTSSGTYACKELIYA